MKSLYLLFLLLNLGLVLFSCSTDESDPNSIDEPAQTLEECIAEQVDTLQADIAYMALQENWAKWNCQNIRDYSFTASRGFGINRCRQAEIKVIVQDSMIISAEVVNDATDFEFCTDQLTPMEGFFSDINVAVDVTIPTGWSDPFNQGEQLFIADGTDISYDETYGFPTSIFINYVQSLGDEELYVTIMDFEVL